MIQKNLFKFVRQAVRSNFSQPERPYRLTYIATRRCQLKCRMCRIWENQRDGELSLPQIDKFFRNSNGFSWINLSGGEIFLRSDIVEVIETIYRNSGSLYLLDFPTNGFDTETVLRSVKKILTFKIPRILVTVSLDGPPGLHDELRGVKGSWESAVATFDALRGLRSSRFDVFLGTTLQESNRGRFPETLEHVEKKIGQVSFSDFHVNLLHHSRHYYGNVNTGEERRRSDRWSELKQIMNRRRKNPLNPVVFLEKRYQQLCRSYLLYGKTPVPCQALSASFFLDSNGDLYPCTIHGKRLGNIKDYGYALSKFWDSDLLKKTRAEIIEGRCPQCWTPCEAYQSILANLLPGFPETEK